MNPSPPAAGSVALEADSLGKRFADGTWGVRDLRLRYGDGDFVALVGANGAGKTTTLHLLSGALKPTTGTARITRGGAPLPAHEIGWSSQRDAVNWYLTVYENVLFGARLAGRSRRDAHALTAEMLELVGLSRQGRKSPDLLSGGEQRRMQIARALVHDPTVALLDEPTAGLDPAGTDLLLRHLRQKSRSGRLVVVSSHDLNALFDHCTHVVHLKEGKVAAAASRQEYMVVSRGALRLQIDYAGDLPRPAQDRLADLASTVFSFSPVDALVRGPNQAKEVRDLVADHTTVLSATENPAGFREVFLMLEAAGAR